MRVVTASLLFVQTLFLSVFISHPVLSEKACVKNASGKVVCGELVPKKKTSTAPATTPKNVVKTKAGVDFTLNGCEKSNAGLTCFISIYNSTDYDKFVGYNNYYLFTITDSEGNVYGWPKEYIVGNQINGSTLPPKMNVRSRVTFIPNGRLTDYIRILKIIPVVENRSFEVVFRDFKVN